MMAEKRSKSKYVSNISRFVIAALILVLILVFAVWLILSLFTVNTEQTRYAFINEGSINDAVKADFLVLNDEELITATRGGLFLPLAREGERLAKGEIYALIVEESQRDLVNSYLELESQIDARCLILSQEISNSDSKMEVKDDLIQEAVSALRTTLFSQKPGLLQSAEDQLESALEKRSQLLRPESFQDEILTDLLREEESLLRKLKSATPEEAIFRTSRPAWVSFSVFPDLPHVNTDTAGSLTVAQLDQILTHNYVAVRVNNAADSLQRGELFARCIYSRELNLLSNLSYQELPESANDRFCIEDNTERMTLDNLKVSELLLADGKALVLNSDHIFSSLFNKAVLQQADLLSVSKKGLIVPRQSLYDFSEEDNIARIFKVKDGTIEEVIVFVLAYDDTHAIIEGRSGDSDAPLENDLYVLNPWTTEAGKLIE